MGRGSLLCAKLCERIVSQFKDNVSQGKIANNWGLSPTTVHNIVKRFRESGEKLVHKGQGWKPLLNARDHRALRRYCLRNRHATMMDIATWARECFGKSLPLNTVCCWIKKLNFKLYYAKRKAFTSFLCLKSSEMDWLTEETWSLVRWDQLVFGKNARQILRVKDEKDHTDRYQQKVWTPASMMV